MRRRLVLLVIAIGTIVGLSAALYHLVEELEARVETNSRWYGEAIWQISQAERALENLRLALATGEDVRILGGVYVGQGRVLPNMPVFGNVRAFGPDISRFGAQIEQTASALASGDHAQLTQLVEEQRETLMQLSVGFAVRSDITPELFDSQRSVFRYWVAGLLLALILSLIAAVLLYEQLQRMRMRRAAAQRENIERLGLFAAGIVHEVNTRLSALKWAWDRAIIGDPEKEAKSAYALIDHLAELTDRMLLLARGSSHIRPEEIELKKFWMREQGELCAIAGPGVQIDADGFEGKIIFDPVHLKSIMTEAISNARDAMEGQGRVVLRHRHGWITIHDTGPGITPSDAERCFEPSFTTKGIKGTGLGLSVVQSIVTAARGEVSLRTHKEGGAILTIVLGDPTGRHEK